MSSANMICISPSHLNHECKSWRFPGHMEPHLACYFNLRRNCWWVLFNCSFQANYCIDSLNASSQPILKDLTNQNVFRWFVTWHGHCCNDSIDILVASLSLRRKPAKNVYDIVDKILQRFGIQPDWNVTYVSSPHSSCIFSQYFNFPPQGKEGKRCSCFKELKQVLCLCSWML